MTIKHALIAFCGAALAIGVAAADDLQVLGSKGDTLLHEYLMGQMRGQYQVRKQAVEAALRLPEAVAQRRDQLREHYHQMLGPLPEKTPLDGKVLGTIQCDGYRIEKVIYQSRPRHHVTANLYIPTTGKPPYPGVLVPCGHSANGKASKAYQSASILLAKNGFATLIYDPISQGERHQLLKAPRHGTTTHTLLGIGALLVGQNTATYRVWDGIRSMDYLAGRAEVDPKRLGCTGNSGGGTMTTWLMAIDDRILAAAPSCFVMTVERLFATIGPQDCEQHFANQGAFGIEHTDFITMRAPKPTLILAAEQDLFDIKGTREAYREAQAVYRMLGQADRVGLFSYDDKHGFSKPRRQAAVQWMGRWLKDDPRPVVEPELQLQSDAALQVSRNGQVVLDYDDEVTVQALNLKRARALASSRREFWKKHDKQTCLAEVRRLIGLRDQRGKTTVEVQGVLRRDAYQIEKLVIRRQGEVPVPGLLFLPAAAGDKQPATLYVDGRGKAAEAKPGGPIEKLLAQGHVVLSIDARGFGETANNPRRSPGKYYNVEYRNSMLAMHIGRPLLGQRVEDVLTALDVLVRRDDVDGDRIDLVGVGRAGPVALHAAALDARFASVMLRDSIRNWVDDIVAKPLEPNLIGHVVPSALLNYDLPDLVAAIAPRAIGIE